MNSIPVLVFVLLACTVVLPAQVSSTSDKYQFGDREIYVPAPDGFTNVVGRFSRITSRMSATESVGTDMLAVHVPQTFIPRLQASEDIDLGFYTKVSAIKSLRTMDVTVAIFKGIVADLEKNFDTYLDPSGTVMKTVGKTSEKGLADIGSKTTVDLTSTKNLGFFEKTPRLFSAMTVISAEIYGRKVTTLASVSVLHVNQRLVTVYAYKMSPADNDVKELTAFTKKWTARIIAANK